MWCEVYCKVTHTARRTSPMNRPATTHVGPLGSTFHILHADPETVTALAAIDWNRHFRRVCLDPVRGLITLMSPSFPHEKLSKLLDDIVEAAGEKLAGTVEVLRSTRLRRQGDPPGTGMEPDCAFYVGERARDFLAELAEGEAAVAFIERTAPDLVVEVEITNADASKIERYAELGVRELWRLHGRTGTRELGVELLALRPGNAPRKLEASEVLEGLTPDDVCEAVEGVRNGETRDARTKAVERVVQRRRDDMVRVREEAAAYSADRAAAKHAPGTARAAPEHVHMDSAAPDRPGQQAP